MEITAKNVLEVYPTLSCFSEREDKFFEVLKEINSYYKQKIDYVDECVDHTCKLFTLISNKAGEEKPSDNKKLRMLQLQAKAAVAKLKLMEQNK